MRYRELLRESDDHEVTTWTGFVYDYLGNFPRGTVVTQGVLQKIKDEATHRLTWAGAKVVVDTKAEALVREAGAISAYLWTLLQQARHRHQNLDDWFTIPSLSYRDLLTKAQEHNRLAQQARMAAPDEDDDDDTDWDDFRDMEGMIPYDPSLATAHFIRFGRNPRGGRSVFGLAGDDTEDGPDDWRVETGGKTHEAGICVFRARRHLSDPQGWVLEMPHFEKAMYSIRRDTDYVLSILPRSQFCTWRADPSKSPVLLIHGSVVTVTTHYRHRGRPIVMADLGSDGEYLIDPAKPYTTATLSPEQIYITDDLKLLDLLDRAGYWRDWEDEVE